MADDQKKSEESEHHAKVISFINMKGGVGKTTLNINIGYTLFKQFNKNVLIIDMDPQFNATQALMTKFLSIDFYQELMRNHQTIASILNKTGNSMVSSFEDTQRQNVIQNLESNDAAKFDVISGDLALTDFESSTRGAEKLLSAFLESDDASKSILDDYDYILIDTPATYSVYSQTSLLASDYYIVPIAPDIFSSLGYDLLQKALQKDLVLKGHNLTNLGVIFTLYNESRTKRTNIKDSFDDVPQFDNKLEENENIRSGNIDNFIYDMSGTSSNIINITSEFIEKLEGESNAK